MRVLSIGVMVGVFGAGLLTGSAFGARGDVSNDTQRAGADVSCGATSKAQVRTTPYFGLARPKGSVSELEWQVFLRDDVTSRFPDGLTVWKAQGQWKQADGVTAHERSKVLLLVRPDTPTARVCAAA